MTEETTFQRKVRERREREAAQAAAEARPDASEYSDLVPEPQYERTDADNEIDGVISRIDIMEAYRRYCGKMNPAPRPGQREGIKVSCPVPGHADKNPSAWINLDKQVWYCEPCRMGGDALDLAAWSKGYPVPGYKEGALFPKLRTEVAQDYGFTITRMAGGVTIVTPPDDENFVAEAETGNSDTSAEIGQNTQEAQETTGSTTDVGDENTDAEVVDLSFDPEIILPSLDWEKVVPKDTFLDAYMQATVIDDVAEEFHFWHGLIALGFALGKDVRLFDFHPVQGNLFVCLMGRSGTGKSKARGYLSDLLDKALPYSEEDEFSKGAKIIAGPASAEFLVKAFQKDVYDPSDPKKVLFQAPIRGLIEYNELSALIGRTSRIGNIIKPALMEFYDGAPSVSSGSMGSGVKRAAHPFASTLTTTQPKALRDLLTDNDDQSGFLNRWVFAGSREKKRYAIGGIRVDITPAVKPLSDIAGWAGTFKSNEFVTWSEEAASTFTHFFETRIEEDKKKVNGGLLVRVDLLMKKLILLFTANRMLKEVPVEAVNEAIFCYDYLVECYGIPAGQIGNTMHTEIADRITAMAKAMKNGVTAREVAKSLQRRKFPVTTIKQVIDSMTALGLLEPHTIKALKGPTTVRYKYVH